MIIGPPIGGQRYYLHCCQIYIILHFKLEVLFPLFNNFFHLRWTRRTNEKSLGKILEEVIKDNNLGDGITQARINEIWVELMSRPIISRTTKLRFINKTLTIYLTSSVIRNELDYQKEELKKQFNDRLGEMVIEKIEFK